MDTYTVTQTRYSLQNSRRDGPIPFEAQHSTHAGFDVCFWLIIYLS